MALGPTEGEGEAWDCCVARAEGRSRIVYVQISKKSLKTNVYYMLYSDLSMHTPCMGEELHLSKFYMAKVLQVYGISSGPTAWMFRRDSHDGNTIHMLQFHPCSGQYANCWWRTTGSTRCTIPMLQATQPWWEHDSYSSVSISTKLWLELYTASFLKWREMSVIYREAWVDVRLGLYNLKATLFFAFSVWTWRFYLIVVAYWLLKAI